MADITLATAVNAILDGMVTFLETKRVPGGVLADVITIARGDRATPAPDTPAIYLVPQKMMVTSPVQSQHEHWEMPVKVGVMVEHDIPVTGYTNATDLAARARGQLLTHTSRNLGLPYVEAVVSSTFDPSGPWNRLEGNYFSAAAEVKVRFKIRG